MAMKQFKFEKLNLFPGPRASRPQAFHLELLLGTSSTRAGALACGRDARGPREEVASLVSRNHTGTSVFPMFIVINIFQLDASTSSKTKSRRRRLARESPGSDEIRARTFQRAVKLLAAKPRSIAELRERLAERCSSKTVIETVIARLREYGYLDDERYALGYASSKVRQQPIGRRRLELSLDRKKVDRAVAGEAADQVFAETLEEELLDRALRNVSDFAANPRLVRKLRVSLITCCVRRFLLNWSSQKVRAVSKANLDDSRASKHSL